MNFNILNVGQSVYMDNSIVSSEYHTYQPYAATTFNNNDEIRIPIQTQNLITLPCQSYLYIDGKLLTEEDKYSDKLKFINNGISFLFDEIRYEIGGTTVDRVKNPGITSTIKGYASFTENESKRLINAGWSPITNPPLLDTKGHFNVCIPLKMLLGFAEDFRKVIMNVRQELVLIRNHSDLNAVVSSDANEKPPKVKINKIFWKMPHISVADVEKLKLYKYLDGRDLEIAFRSWELQEYPLLQETQNHTWTVKTANQLEKPRFVIVALQSNKRNQKTTDMSQFDHCTLTNIKLYLNSEMYPYDNLNITFDNQQWAILYEMYAQFQQSYYYKNENEPLFSPLEFINTAPLVVIDCSRQDESLKNGPVDIRLEFETKKNIPTNTSAYCLILHDRMIKYNPLTNIVKMY